MTRLQSVKDLPLVPLQGGTDGGDTAVFAISADRCEAFFLLLCCRN